MMERSLLEELEIYQKSDYYPFHMPGHKRNPQIDYIPAEIDITEIDGFDNLHHPQGILKAAQKRAAELYGAEESFFLVNGSTSGILAAISAAVESGGSLLMARNSHKAAYHGAFLRNLRVQYLYPEIMGDYGICGGISPKQTEELLASDKDIQAVFITSPTYEGMVSNIEEIADIVHRYGKILIVDEAHGAHFGIAGNDFPKSAVAAGADIVIQSIHKTLPSLTQTAILHVQGSYVDRSRLRRYLQIYQTSSPSYVFMAGIDSCIRLMERRGNELFRQYQDRLQFFYKEAEKLEYLSVLNPKEAAGSWEVKEMDASKICIFTGRAAMSGVQLYEILLERYHLQMEMSAGNYVLAMTSVMDTLEGFERLLQALCELDREIARMGRIKGQEVHRMNHRAFFMGGRQLLKASEVENMEGEVLPITECVGRISKEYRYVYPPGVPVLVPGECISGDTVELLEYYEETGLNVLGQEHADGLLEVTKFVIVEP